MSAHGSGSTEFLRVLATAAARDGLEIEDVRRLMAVPGDLPEKRGVRVPIAVVRRAWSGLTDGAAGPLLSLRAARRLPPGSLDILDYLAQTSTTGPRRWTGLTPGAATTADGTSPPPVRRRGRPRPRAGEPSARRLSWPARATSVVAGWRGRFRRNSPETQAHTCYAPRR